MAQKRIIKVRISEDAHAEIEAAAVAADLPVAIYVRTVALKAARADSKCEAA